MIASLSHQSQQLEHDQQTQQDMCCPKKLVIHAGEHWRACQHHA
jgi:hypothetical protein